MKLFIALLISILPSFLKAQNQVAFSEKLIDSLAAGDNKAIADVDNDGIKDLVLGGNEFSWYRNENGKYQKYTIAVPRVEFSTDMEVGDFDNDGDVDFLVADGKDENSVMWFENPLPALSPEKVSNWKNHIIGTHGNWMHNVAIGDVNLDNRVDVVSSGHGVTRLWLNKGKEEWQQINLSSYGSGSVDVCDMDGDGDLDLITTKGWVECPEDAFNQEWNFHLVQGLSGETVKAGDIDNDGIPEIFAADSAHVNGRLFMFRMDHPGSGDNWKKTEIDPECGTHKLQIADFNRDGYADIFFGLELKALGILYQQATSPGTFKKQIISPKGGHNAIADDIDNDGDLDILSCDFLKHPPLKLFVNESVAKAQNKNDSLSIHRWRYSQVTGNHMQTFGLTFGEVTGDGNTDIISGSYVYENPGKAKNSQNWKQYLVGKDLHAVIATDINNDNKDEIIAVDGEINVYWCEGSRNEWKTHLLGRLPKASHPIGSQGHIKGQIIPGGKPEIIMTAGKGIYAFQIPPDPLQKWPMIHISEQSADEGIDIADFNHDGWNDIAGTFGDTHKILWYENPKSFKSNWKTHTVGEVAAGKNYLDRVAAADLNGDKKPDIIVTEENQGGPATTYVFLQGVGLNGENWHKEELVKQSTTNSMSTADMDKDGDIDIILGEHRGQKRLTIWQNNGKGKFRPFLIDKGKESHDGAKLFDLDKDGDLDIISIAYDKYQALHVWWNDSIKK